jgi:hypothetical protein
VWASASRRSAHVAGSTTRGATPTRTTIRKPTPASASPDSSTNVAAAAQLLLADEEQAKTG